MRFRIDYTICLFGMGMYGTSYYEYGLRSSHRPIRGWQGGMKVKKNDVLFHSAAEADILFIAARVTFCYLLLLSTTY